VLSEAEQSAARKAHTIELVNRFISADFRG